MRKTTRRHRIWVVIPAERKGICGRAWVFASLKAAENAVAQDAAGSRFAKPDYTRIEEAVWLDVVSDVADREARR